MRTAVIARCARRARSDGRSSASTIFARVLIRWLTIAALVAGCPRGPGFEDAGVFDAGTVEDAGAIDAGADAGSPLTAELAPMRLVDFGVFVELTLDGQGPFLLRYDTGSPTTYLDRAHAGSLAAGMHAAALGAVSLGMRPVTLIDWLEVSVTYPGLPGPVLGLAG